ncbi:MAG: AAA family ATPase [Planctomycetota bacterium]
MARITAIQAVEFSEVATGKLARRTFNLEKDIPALEAAIQQTADCRLVVVDPVTAYLSKTDSHKNADIRGLLAPLCPHFSPRGWMKAASCGIKRFG